MQEKNSDLKQREDAAQKKGNQQHNVKKESLGPNTRR